MVDIDVDHFKISLDEDGLRELNETGSVSHDFGDKIVTVEVDSAIPSISAPPSPVSSVSKAPHEVLGVEPDASPETVKQAYREEAKQRHTDTGGSVEAFKELNEAKDEMLEDTR